MSVEGRTLTLNTYLLLNADPVIQEVINGEVTCDKIVLLGTAGTFDGRFLGSDSYDKFWKKLGESVTSLEIHQRTTLNLGLYLSNVRCLYIEKPGIFEDILLSLSDKNVALEEVSISENLIDFGVTEPKWVDLNVDFFRMLRPFQDTLKSVTFECSVPLQEYEVWKLCSELTKSFQDLDDVSFDCEPVPKVSSWLIEKIQIEFGKGENISKIVVKPLFLRQMYEHEKDCDYNRGEFKSGSVKKLSFLYNEEENFLNCFINFPSAVKVTNLPIRDSNMLGLLLKHLYHLKDLHIFWNCYYIETWPSCMTSVETVTITFYDIDYKNFAPFFQIFPNLRKLSVTTTDLRFNYDKFAKMITENAKSLKYLSIQCDFVVNGVLTSVDLDLIRDNLKELKELHVDCLVSFFDIENLFEELPTLEVFSYKYSSILRKFLKYKPLPNEKEINDLPPELLEQIFLYLTTKEQIICRQVCQYWCNIQKSSPYFDHTLDLSNSYLSYKEEPVKILVNTNFNYNSIIFDGTTFELNDDLSKFWEDIGAEVKDICIKDRDFVIMDAAKMGLKAHHFPNMKKLTFEDVRLFYALLQQNLPEWNTLLNQVEKFQVDLDTCSRTELEDFDIQIKYMSNVTQLTILSFNTENCEDFSNRLFFPNMKTFISFFVSMEITQIFQTNFNFAQIKTLFLGVCDQVDANDSDLITKNCPNVECLGICLENWEAEIIPDGVFDIIAKKMFDQLLSFKVLSLMKFSDDEINDYKVDYVSFQRTNSGIEKSNKACSEFDDVMSMVKMFCDS